MLKTRLIKFSIVILAFVFLANLQTAAQTSDCTSQSDTDLVMAIYQKLKAKYPKEYKNINVTAKDGVVKLEGWVASEKTLNKIVALVKKVKCVKEVVNELEVGKGGGCGPGQKPCGGTCIGEKEVCNICLIDPAGPECVGSTTDKKEQPKKDQE